VRHFDWSPDRIGAQWRNLLSSERYYASVSQISRLRFASLEMTGEELDYAAGK
jgi:hypothetical protein